MARIQILELPTIYRENGEDETPFALIVDQVSHQEAAQQFAERLQASKDDLGARAVLVFAGTMEIPNNWVGVVDGQAVRLKVEADLSRFEEQAAEAAKKAQRGISQSSPR